MAISKPSRNLHRRFRRRKIEKTNKTKPKILYRKYQWTNDYGKFTKKKKLRARVAIQKTDVCEILIMVDE